jgi:hypothetical protein
MSTAFWASLRLTSPQAVRAVSSALKKSRNSRLRRTVALVASRTWNVAGSLANRRSEYQLWPAHPGDWLDTVPRFGTCAETNRAEDRHHRACNKQVDLDLDVDTVLRGKAGNSCGADVVHAMCERTERGPEPGGEGLELPRPIRVVVHNHQIRRQLVGERHDPTLQSCREDCERSNQRSGSRPVTRKLTWRAIATAWSANRS